MDKLVTQLKYPFILILLLQLSYFFAFDYLSNHFQALLPPLCLVFALLALHHQYFNHFQHNQQTIFHVALIFGFL